ncbi:hypothetical protein HKD37_01G000937 [Glycine soja]
MATPPSFPPPPPTNVASQSSSTLKWTRKATRLRSLATRPARAERQLRTYLGIFVRDKVDVTYENWKQVPTAQKDLIWEDIQVEFDILEASDPTRTVSMTLYAKNTALARRNGPNFVRVAEILRGRMCEKRHRPSRSKILPPTCCLVGLMDEKTNKKLEEAGQSGSTEAMIDPPSPIRQHIKWKMARTKKTGQMTSEAAKEIADKIDSLKELTSQGSFVAHGRQDVLTATIGRPEHPGCVRAAGVNVTIKQYFGLTPRTSCTSSSMAPEGLEHLTQQIRDQLEESITEKGLALPPELEVGPLAACVSAKESCVDPLGKNPDSSDSDKCGLYIEENPPRLVALGRVGVEEVRDADAPIPVPTEEVKLVGQTLNTFLAWPTHLVKRLSEQGAVGPAKPADRQDHEVDDPLYLMALTIPQLFLKPLQVMWDATMFGVFNEDFPLYIKHEDLSEIAYGGQCLSISIIQLWILHMTKTSMRAGNVDVYGFLEPQSIQRSGQSQFELESYMKNWMQNSKRDVYLGA